MSRQQCATARSRLPSPLKSPTATDLGNDPISGYFTAGFKVPSPLPRSTLIAPFRHPWPFVHSFATTTSSLPSLLKSPVATADVCFPADRFVPARVKLPSPLPNSTLTSPFAHSPLATHQFAATTSGLPSPLRSPIAMDVGRYPPELNAP